MKKTIASLFLLSFFFSAFANPDGFKDTGKVTGKVLDHESKPLGFANVILFNSADSAMVKAEYTKDDGTFELQNVPAGSFWLTVTFVGMPDFVSQPFNVTAGETKDMLSISMKAPSLELSEVTVTARKPIVEVHPDKTVFNVEGSINATGNNAMELLRKAPGVVVDNNDNVILSGKSGVKIYIDGKPTHLSTQDLAAYLRTVQASDISTIEIITNPSAKWDAEGNAGIINIRMKKDKRLGANGTANLGYSVGEKQAYEGSLSGNYRNKRFNTFGRYSYNQGDWLNDFNLNREQFGTSFIQGTNGVYEESTHGFKLGTDFFLNDKNTLGFLVNGYNSDFLWASDSRTAIRQVGSGIVDSSLIASSDNDGLRSNYNFNLNYRFDDAKGSVWNVDADYGFFKNRGEELQPNRYFFGEYAEGELPFRDSTFATNTLTDIDIATFKLDNERPFLKGQLGAGLKFSYVKTNNDFDFFKVIENENILDPNRTNQFVYDEYVSAAYANYSRQLGKFGFQAGLRVEQTHSKGDLNDEIPGESDEEKPLERDYLDFFPSGGITWAQSQKHSFQLTYSRRLNRPSYQDLNPFKSKLDELTYQFGNQKLKPEYTHSVQLTHTFMYMYNTSLSYSHTTDLISRLVDIDPDNSSASFITWENLAQTNNVSLNLSAPVQITKWWNSYANLSAYRSHSMADFTLKTDTVEKIVDLTVYAFNIYAQQTFTLPMDMAFEVSGWYNSPSVWGGTMEMESMWSIDAGLQKKFLKGKGTVKVSVSDIFFTQKWSGKSRFGELYTRANGSNDSRRFRVNLTYTFGNDQVKDARNRSTGLEDEKGRIKTGN